MNRRGFLFGAGTAGLLIAAPSIVRAADLMAISGRNVEPRYYGDGIHDDLPNLQWQANQTRGSYGRITFKPRTYYTHGTLEFDARRANHTIDFSGTVIDSSKNGWRAAMDIRNTPNICLKDWRMHGARRGIDLPGDWL